MKTEPVVRPVEFEDLTPLAREAKRERLSFKPTQNTQWFGAYLGNELVGCAAVIYTDATKRRIRLKSWLVLPEWRGHGVGRALNQARMAWATDQGVKEFEVITRHPKIYRLLGFDHIPGKKWSWMQRIDP